MVANSLIYGRLPAVAGPWAEALDQYHVALSGQPEVIDQRTTAAESHARDVQSIAWDFDEKRQRLVLVWKGDAADVFGTSSHEFYQAVRGLDRPLMAGHLTFDRVAGALRDSRAGLESTMTWFGNAVREMEQRYYQYMQNAPPPPPMVALPYYHRLQETAMVSLQESVNTIGRAATRRAGVIEGELNRVLDEAADELRRNTPQGVMPTIARTFSSDFRKATRNWWVDPTADRSLLNFLGLRKGDAWDPSAQVSIPPSALGSAAIGVPASTAFNILVNKADPMRAPIRGPGNFTTDLLNLGGLNPDGTLVYPFEDPFLNRFAAASASAGLGVAVDQGLKWAQGNVPAYWTSQRLDIPVSLAKQLSGGYDVFHSPLWLPEHVQAQKLKHLTAAQYEAVRRTGELGAVKLQALAHSKSDMRLLGSLLDHRAFTAESGFAAPNRWPVYDTLSFRTAGKLPPSFSIKPRWPAASGLHPGTLASLPFTVWAGNTAADAIARPPLPTDENNNHYYRNLAWRSALTGLAISGPVGLQSGSPKSAGYTFLIVTGQNAAAQFLFTEPPHPDNDAIWQIGGARPAVEQYVDGADYVDWKYRRGDSPSDGVVTNSVKTLKSVDSAAYELAKYTARIPYPPLTWASNLVRGEDEPWPPPLPPSVGESLQRATDSAGEVVEDTGDGLWRLRNRVWVPAEVEGGSAPGETSIDMLEQLTGENAVGPAEQDAIDALTDPAVPDAADEVTARPFEELTETLDADDVDLWLEK